MSFYFWTAVVNTVTTGFAGLFMLSRHERDPRRITFAAFALSVAWWSFFYALWQLATSERIALLFCRWLVAGCVLVLPSFLHHISTLVGRAQSRRQHWLIMSQYAIAGLFLLANWTPLVVREVAPRLSFRFWPLPGPLWPAYTLWFCITVAYAVMLITKSLTRATGTMRQQLKYLLVGTVIAFVGGSTNFLLWYDIPIPPVGNIVVPFYVLLAAVATIRYQFMDLKLAFTRTGLLLSTYLVVLGGPFLIGWMGREWLEERFGQHWWLVPLSLCTGLATLGPFAYAYLRRQAEARLLKEQRRYQRTLQYASRGMTRVRDVTRLCNLVTRVVSRTVKVEHASLFLLDRGTQHYILRASHGPARLSIQSRYHLESSHPFIKRLREHGRVSIEERIGNSLEPVVRDEMSKLGAVLAVPGLIEKDLIGFLALGLKLSQDGYSPDDLHAFTTLANEAAIAIENAMSYEELLKVNEQLKVASERLLVQERLAAAGQIATGMAHEVKNPLSAIKTFAQYLPEKYADPEFRRKFFRIVQAEIDRINTIVQQLSDFAKPAPPRFQPIRLASVVDDTLALLSGQCLKQGIEIQKAFGENGQLVQVDPQQIKQALLNLFLNSLEAMPAGGRLRVETQLDPPYLTLRIVDTGSGIPPEHGEQVWDPFFTTKERGMGLGLAIVRGVVERHGGQVSITGRPGQGTVVSLNLPLIVQTTSSERKTRS